jgi:mRNA interferase MazF
MARFVRGDVVVVPFPFSDLSQAKRRPALVLAELAGDDRILCQITSRSLQDPYAIHFDDEDFEEGGLRRKSNVRPNRIFTADMRIILYRAGHLKEDKTGEVIKQIIGILEG